MMKMLNKSTLVALTTVGLLTAIPSANAAALVVGDLALDNFGTPDLTTFSASLNYDYTAMCFDGSGTSSGACGTDNGQKGKNKVTYNGAVDTTNSFGVLTIAGTSMAVDNGSGLEGVSGTYNLTANFTGAGLFDALGSSVDVNGSSSSFAGPDFLTAGLTDFGYAGDTGSFELLFAATFTSGSFATDGTLGGVHITGASALGSWQADWSATANVNTAVLAPVPVPAAAWLFGSGLLAFAGLARRKTTA